MRDVMKHLGTIYDGDSLEDLLELSNMRKVEIRGGLAMVDNRGVGHLRRGGVLPPQS